MFNYNWGAFFRGLAKAAKDLKDDSPLPVAETDMSSEDLLSSVDALQAICVKLRAEIEAHPGKVRALEDVLEGAKSAGLGEANNADIIVHAAPNVVGEIVNLLPKLRFVLQEIQPAPIGIPGGWSGARGHI